MLSTTISQLFDRNKLFRLVFICSVITLIIGLILCIIYSFAYCKIYQTCTYWKFTSPNECVSKGVTYCCSNIAPICNSLYCVEKPDSYGSCEGIIIVGGLLVTAGVLLAIYGVVVIYNFRKKVKSGAYLEYYQSDEQPITIYSDQTQQHHYAANPVDQSNQQ